MKRIFALISAVALIVVLATGCMSEQEKALKRSVDEYSSTLPQNVASGVEISSASYNRADSTVTLVCEISDITIATGLKHTTGMVKMLFIPYLKSQRAVNPMVDNLIAAKASLKCDFYHSNDLIGSFTVTSSEIE